MKISSQFSYLKCRTGHWNNADVHAISIRSFLIMVLLPLVPFWLYLAHFKSLAFSDFVACFFFYVMFMYNLRLKGSIKELQISVYGAILFTIWQRHCHSNQQKWTSSTVYACGLQMFTDQEYPIGFLQQPIRENSKALNTRIYVIGKGFQIKCISLDAALQRCRSFWWFSQIKKRVALN